MLYSHGMIQHAWKPLFLYHSKWSNKVSVQKKKKCLCSQPKRQIQEPALFLLHTYIVLTPQGSTLTIITLRWAHTLLPCLFKFVVRQQFFKDLLPCLITVYKPGNSVAASLICIVLPSVKKSHLSNLYSVSST